MNFTIHFSVLIFIHANQGKGWSDMQDARKIRVLQKLALKCEDGENFQLLTISLYVQRQLQNMKGKES